MLPVIPFLAPIALFVISFGLVSLISKHSEWRFLKIVGLTILTVRIISYLTIYFIGSTQLWATIYSDNWNHFQLGLLLILVAILLRKLKKGTFIRMAGVGLGLVLDEITDVFKLFGYPFTAHFRDSFNDLLLIVTVFLIVVLIAKLVKLKK